MIFFTFFVKINHLRHMLLENERMKTAFILGSKRLIIKLIVFQFDCLVDKRLSWMGFTA